MTDAEKTTTVTKIISAKSARMIARLFNLGNLFSLLPAMIISPIIIFTEIERTMMIMMFIAIIVPFILWFGISIMIYIIARHHPNEMVGHFTQMAAYRYYGMIGIIIPVGTFYGTDWELWIITAGIVGVLLIPWTLVCLYKIQKANWQDTEIEIKETEGVMA